MEETITNAIHALVIVAICCGTLYLTHTMWEISRSPITKIEVQYDCRLAEISVDYPAEVKQKCRKLLTPEVRAVHE
jgi:hypothetical protein